MRAARASGGSRWLRALAIVAVAARCEQAPPPGSPPADAAATAANATSPTGDTPTLTPPPPPVVAPTPRPSEPRGRFVQSDVEPFEFAVEPLTIDLGVLRPDEDANCSFEIVNRDARPLRLVNIDGSCDCVGFNWKQGDLPPGTRRRVDVAIRAENRGNKQLTAFVQANDRVVTTHQVAIRYSIEPDLLFDPPRADFGQRVVGTAAPLALRVRYRLPAGSAALALAPRLSVDVPITIELGAAVADSPVGGLVEFDQSLLLTLDASRKVAPFRGELRFESPGHRRGVLPVTGAVHDGAWLEHAELQLGVTEVGQSRRGTTRIRWTTEPADVEEISCSSPDLTAQAHPEAGARSLRLQVEFKPSVAGDFAGDVTIRIKQAPEPLVLHVRAKVR